jgi:uncharacterized protein YecE (DUF72 family)
MLRIGTSGFGYHEWCPGFYPPGLSYADYLPYYARHFDCCELTHTFFRLPGRADLDALILATPDHFEFTAKLDRRLTHERSPHLDRARRVVESFQPLVEAGRLGAVVAQFPFSFVNVPENRAYVCRLRAALELPLVAEFRNDSWLRYETIQFLRGWGIGLAAVDLPPLLAGMPRPTAHATSTLGYVRFHGRNAAFWWKRGDPRRYEYRYRQKELLSWLPRVKNIDASTETTYVIFNNRRHGHAIDDARRFQRLLVRSRQRQQPRRTSRVG